jgi:hypothetical protein
VVRKTPWWAISVGLHTLAVLILGFFVVVTSDGEGRPEVEIIRPRETPPPPVMVEAPTVTPMPIAHPDTVENPVLTRDKDLINQSIEDDFHPTVKGDPDQMSDKPLKGPSANAVIGGGGGSGGRRGDPFGGRLEGRRSGKTGTRIEADEAAMSALRWLARHQSPDGAWSVQGHVAQCGKVHAGKCSPNPETASADFDPGVTGLAVLAFLGAGYSHLSKDCFEGLCFGDVVRRGVQWMIAHQDTDGSIGSPLAHKAMYNHAICALALCEAYGLTGSKLFEENARRAVDFLVAAQNPGKGWRYSSKSGDNDTSVTGWAVMVLKSAELSGLTFPRTAYDGARAWLAEVTEESYGRAGYSFKGTGKVVCAHNSHFEHQEALTAISVMCRIFMDKNPHDPMVKNGAQMLMRQLPAWDGPQIDFYAWYYEALALFQADGPKGALFTKWNASMVDALVKPQNTRATGCKYGSWEPVDRWSCEGGRVYATAINTLTLEVYYRYANVFTGKSH